MYCHVPFKRTVFGKWYLTELAFVGFLSRMYCHVLFQELPRVNDFWQNLHVYGIFSECTFMRFFRLLPRANDFSQNLHWHVFFRERMFVWSFRQPSWANAFLQIQVCSPLWSSTWLVRVNLYANGIQQTWNVYGSKEYGFLYFFSDSQLTEIISGITGICMDSFQYEFRSEFLDENSIQMTCYRICLWVGAFQ